MNMKPDNSSLAEGCGQVETLLSDALQWFDEHPDLPAARKQAVLRQLKSYRLEARRLTRAAARPMCVAIFGPSQVGKSWLIESLARKQGESLAVALGDGTRDFLEEINPQGGGTEATGLVTRFTLRQLNAPAGYPVAVRLLSRADLIKILCNTFFLDFAVAFEVKRAPEPAEVEARLATAREAAGAAAILPGSLTEDELVELKEYFQSKFESRHTEELLRRCNFWDDAAALAGRLDASRWLPLLELLWGRVDKLTEFYRFLEQAMARIGYATEAFCEIPSLITNANSIIDINTLDRLGEAGEEEVNIVSASGKKAGLSRSVLAAMVSELIMPLKTKPYNYFEHTDILDFPGYRPRLDLQSEKADAYLAGDSALKELFRRGKVDYLFDAYTREQEITSLLLCTNHEDQNVHSIPPLIAKWVRDTHGETPEERRRSQTALFCVRTKFDLRFERGARKMDDTDERWLNAIQRQHLEFLGRAADWPHQWTPGRPFSNIFWVRSPKMKNKNLLKYHKNGNESGFEDPDFIAFQKNLYLSTPEIQQCITNPERAWDEVMRLNDGGISYLINALQPVCNPDIKSKQVAVRLVALLKKTLPRLQDYYVSGDLEEANKKRLEMLEKAIHFIISCALGENFGRFIQALQVETDEMALALRRALNHNRAQNPASGQAALSRDRILQRMRGPGSGARTAHNKPKDRIALSAETALDLWRAHILNSADTLSTLALCEQGTEDHTETTLSLVAQLVTVLERSGIDQKISDKLTRFTTDLETNDEFIEKAAPIAVNALNSFVWKLGYQDMAEDQRPVYYDHENQPVPIFTQCADRVEDVDISQPEKTYLEGFLAQWCEGFEAAVKKSIETTDAIKVDHERNQKLGAMIEGLQTAESAMGISP